MTNNFVPIKLLRHTLNRFDTAGPSLCWKAVSLRTFPAISSAWSEIAICTAHKSWLFQCQINVPPHVFWDYQARQSTHRSNSNNMKALLIYSRLTSRRILAICLAMFIEFTRTFSNEIVLVSYNCPIYSMILPFYNSQLAVFCFLLIYLSRVTDCYGRRVRQAFFHPANIS